MLPRTPDAQWLPMQRELASLILIFSLGFVVLGCDSSDNDDDDGLLDTSDDDDVGPSDTGTGRR